MRLWYSLSACFLHRHFSITLNFWGKEERDRFALILTLGNWSSSNDAFKKVLMLKKISKLNRGFKHKYKLIYIFMAMFLFILLHIWFLEVDKSKYLIYAESFLNLLWNIFILLCVMIFHVNLLWLKKEKNFDSFFFFWLGRKLCITCDVLFWDFLVDLFHYKSLCVNQISQHKFI